jgi:glycosyltransferase involved in cell wall biosynthesis
MARFALDGPLSGIPCVVDLIDADSSKWTAMSDAAGAPMRWIYKREARLLGGFEVRIMREAFATLVVNEKERHALLALEPEGRVRVIENGIDLTSFTPSDDPAESTSVVFCGVMNYAPNVQGALWLAREVWPLVRAANPDARLLLVGASPTSEVLALGSRDAAITVTGTVDDVRPYLRSAAVAVAPLHIARGVQNKVLEAVAAGLPCVVTPAVAEGLPPEVRPACLVGRDAHGFATAVSDLLDRSPTQRRAMVSSADLTSLLWSARLAPLMGLLEDACGASSVRTNSHSS